MAVGVEPTLVGLQAALERSLANATPLTRQFFADTTWDAEEVQRFVNQTMTASVATVRPDGRPHAAWVLAACTRGTIYFTAATGSVLLRNLRRNPAVALTVTNHVHGVMADGKARCMGTAREVPDLVEEIDLVVRRAYLIPPGWDGELWALDVDHIFAN